MNKKPKVHPEQGRKVFVGISGGVDSSVALALLKEQGYDVTGVFLKVWNPDWMECNWKEERQDSMRVCATLGVAHITLDCEAEYKRDVVDYMIREYREGRVPNPDVFCNKYIKFGLFLKKALEMGADFIATGHYTTRIIRIGSNDTNEYELHESVDHNKDQSYFLYTVGQHELSHTLFPVGGMTKGEVRKLAKKFRLPTAEKKDSQGLCFIGKIDMKDFLSHYISVKKGSVLNTKGEIIGEHDGAMFYTIGQRHGFTITKKSSNDPRFFVISKDMITNTITIADKELESEMVYSVKEIVLKDLHFISPRQRLGLGELFDTMVRIRYRQEKQNCTVLKKSDGHHIIFQKAQDGVAVGQSAVLYDGDICLGGGIIEKAVR